MVRILIVLTAMLLMQLSTVSAAENNSCILLKFGDETRFYKLGTADSLSDLVMEKLIASGKFKLSETKPIDKDIEELLYEKNAMEYQQAQQSDQKNNYDDLFEGVGFDDKKAKSLNEATEGQIIDPEITSAIGKEHNAGYIIQGTIVNMGTAKEINENLGKGMRAAGTVADIANVPVVGTVFKLFGGAKTKKNILGVLCDIRVLDAETGEVVYYTQCLGKTAVKKHSVDEGVIEVGGEMSNETYAKAVDNAAELIAASLIKAVDDKKLFATEG